MSEKFRVTYATLSADNEDLQRNYDEAAERVRAELGKEYPIIVNGEERWTEERYDEPSPVDSNIVIGRFSQASASDVDDAVKAAKAFSLEWERMGWQRHIGILRTVADVMEALGPARANVPCSPVYTVDELLRHPQLLARDMVVRVAHAKLGEVTVPGVTVKLSDTPGAVHRLGPELGEHNAEIYQGLLGLGADELSRLRAAEVV